MVYEVVSLGDPVLRSKAKAVELSLVEDKKFQKLIDDMIDTMRDYDGVGIAAPQIGVPLQIFCVECKGNKRYKDIPNIPVYTVINPKVKVLDKNTASMYEGCLSIPDLRAEVHRARRVELTGWNRHGEKIKIDAKGFHARIIQHENDHLNGKVYLDRVKDTKTLCYIEHL